MKNELEKNPVNKNNIVKLYKRMYTALGDLQAQGLGPFRRKFIQVWLSAVALIGSLLLSAVNELDLDQCLLQDRVLECFHSVVTVCQ